MNCLKTSLIAVGMVFAVSHAVAEDVTVKIENFQSAGGFSFTPFWLGFHDGNFDTFNAGMSASMGITAIAEVGDASLMSTRFGNEQPNGVDTVFVNSAGAPVFSPGESESLTIDIGDASTNRYLQYASMVVPSNDLFIGNDNPLMLFDMGGAFQGPIVIDIFGASIWDNGSEVNDITDGPAFVDGVDGAAGTDEGGTIGQFFSVAGADAYITSINGTVTPIGAISQGFGRDTHLGRITITPEPSSLVLLGLCSFLLARRR